MFKNLKKKKKKKEVKMDENTNEIILKAQDHVSIDTWPKALFVDQQIEPQAKCQLALSLGLPYFSNFANVIF